MVAAADAAQKLRASLDVARGDFTVADAAAASGLSLHDAEQGLHALVSEYRGHLRVTDDGDIVFRFPTGFSKPWVVPDALSRAAGAVGRAAAGAARFVVRAWVAIVLLAYVALFLAMIVGLFFLRASGSSSSDTRGRSSSSGGGFGTYLLFRMVTEALFWTFHPFSPMRAGAYEVRSRRGRAQGAWGDTQPAQRPFYERVDRFFFGPPAPAPEPDAEKRAVIAEIRAGKGRIGLADVMRITGWERARIDPLMSELLVGYDGSVEVSEDGGISYAFPALRKTAHVGAPPRAKAIWQAAVEVPPLTGNTLGENLVIGGLNAFNLVMSGWVLSQGLTVERLVAMFSGVPTAELPAPGVSLALGVVPLVFSILLFALPIGRALLRPWREKRAARERGRRAVLEAVLEGARTDAGVREEELVRRYRFAAGVDPDPKELTRAVTALGGDVDLARAEGGVRYRFQDLELEARAVEAEREAASEEEAKLGKVVFSSED